MLKYFFLVFTIPNPTVSNTTNSNFYPRTHKMQSTSPQVTLISSDGIEIQTTHSAVKKCVTLGTMLEILDSSKTAGKPIPVLGADAETLRVVMRWCEQDLPSTTGQPDDGKIQLWVEEFLTKLALNRDLFFKVIKCANYLEIELLLQSALGMLARTIENMSTEQMREYLNIQNDYTPEEEAEIRRTHAWAYEETGEVSLQNPDLHI